jgi:putative ATP-binding cassette transporter
MADLWKMIAFLLKPSKDGNSQRLSVLFVLLAGMASGAASTALIVLVSNALARPSSIGERTVWTFFALCAALPIARFISASLLIRLAQNVIYELRIKLSRRILAAPLRRLEELGPHRLLATLTDDTSTIADVFTNLPLLIIHLTVSTSCLIYIGWISWQAVAVVAGFIVLGVLTYRLAVGRALVFFRRMREQWDELFQHLRGLTEGTKELKLHGDRRQSFMTDLLETSAASVRKNFVSGAMIFAGANGWTQSLTFLLIATLFLLRFRGIVPTDEILTRLVMVFLYMRAPIEALVTMVPNLNRSVIAVQKVNQLGLSLAKFEEPKPAGPAVPAWRSLEVNDVTHSYKREGDDSLFTLGPANLRFAPGQLAFIVGGNGSGKTTLAKILLGLYVPVSGEIRFDGVSVSDENREWYMQHFSAVFSDFYLFNRLLGFPDAEARARTYLALLQLDKKVRVEDNTLSTLALSQGQRKRLALLVAYLEDRPIYLFDEWAADQDPEFKEIFYRQLLPELKGRGKTVIVISHDDRYFHLADRIVKLESGQVVYDGDVEGYFEVGRELAHGIENGEAIKTA